MTRWLFLASGVLATILGLLLAARAGDPAIHIHGFMIAGFGVGLSFWLIGRWPLGAEAGHATAPAEAPAVVEVAKAREPELV